MTDGHNRPKYAYCRDRRGSSLVETVLGSIIIVMIALFLVDVASIVICQTQNDALAKHCARAASNQDNSSKATTAVNDVITEFQKAGGGSKICVFQNKTLTWSDAQVFVKTEVTCNFPVPIPFGPASMNFMAEATEPVVAVLPSAPSP